MGTRTVVVNGKFQKSTPKGSEAGDFLWIHNHILQSNRKAIIATEINVDKQCFADMLN